MSAGGAVGFLDTLPTILARIEATDAAGAARGLAGGLADAMALIQRQTAAGRKLMFVGNGGSAAIASHMAVDYWKNGGMRAITFNDASLLTCLANDYGYPHVFEKPVEMFADAGDVLLAISSSGRSENILAAARAARVGRCFVITLSGFAPDNPLRGLGDVNFYAPATTYGHVEIAHLAICHAMVDALIEARGGRRSGDGR